MTQDVTSRVLRLFESRLRHEPAVSAATVRVLLEEQRETDFGADEEVLDGLLHALEDEG